MLIQSWIAVVEVEWLKSTAICTIVAIAALLACAGCEGSTSADVQFGYTTPFLPITITVDNHGNIGIHGTADIVTPLGTFSVSADVTKAMASQSGATLLIIRHKKDGVVLDAVYAIQTQEIVVILNGRVTLTVTNGRVFVNASKGQVLSIKIQSTASQPPSTPPVLAGQPLKDPLTSSEHSSGWPNGPYYPPAGDAEDQPIDCGFKSDGFHVGPSWPIGSNWAMCENQKITFGNGAISVTATLVSNDSSDRSADNSDDEGYGVLIRTDTFPTIGFSVLPDGSWIDFYSNGIIDPHPANPAIRRGLNVSNRLTIRADGSTFQFYVNGVKIGYEVGSSAPAEGGVGFYVDGYDSAVYKDLVIKS